ncbi:MBL fold metallo-hydrolase [soil metagenome]
MQIGDYTVDAVHDGEFALDRSIPYPDVSAEQWEPYEHLLRDRKQVVNQLGGYLVRGGDTVALVDLGFGPTQVPTWESGAFLDSLSALGVTPADVTDVFFTHLHFDHIGWAAVNGDPVFPNAVHRCHARDWEHFRSDDHEDVAALLGPGADVFPDEMKAPRKLEPIAHLMQTWTGSTTIRPGFDVVEYPGHTPGTSVVSLTSRGQGAMFIGDIAHHQAELLEPDIHFIADMDPGQASRSQDELVGLLAETGTAFAGAHFLDFAWGRVERASTGYTWVPLAEQD